LAVLLIALIAAAWRGHTVAVCVWNAGFMTMTFYLLTLLLFQIVYGSVYRDLAVLVSGYMCGALIGAFSGKRLAARPYRAGVFAVFQAALAVFGLALSGALIAWPAVAGFLGARAGMWLLFPLVSGLIGVFGGVQFPLAVQAYGPSGGRAPARAAAFVYGIDVIGASAGALLAGVFLIPAFGIPITCIVCTVFSIIGLGMYWTAHH